MANGHGGYRQPSNPAPVSGPGAHSQRTDGGPTQMDVTGMPYGQAQQFRQQQQQAPLSAPSTAPSAPPPQYKSQLTGLDAPTQDPNQPVTAGANAGPGPNSADIGLQQQQFNKQLADVFGPALGPLSRMADSPYSTQEHRQAVRELRARIIDAVGG